LVSSYALIGVFLAISLVFGAAPIILAWFFSPKKPNPRKSQIYESGNPTFGETWIEYKAQYYLFGLAFVTFGIEAVLLFPWAMAYSQLPLYAVVEALVFMMIFGVGLVYVWLKGWLEWM